jgi:hypothetical protein
VARVVVTANTLTGPAWIGDYLDREHLLPGGAQLVAAEFLSTDAVVVTVGAAGALAAATSVPVDALTGPIPSGTVLSFGTNKFARLTAAAALGATSLTVAALPTALVDNDTATYSGVGPRRVVSGTLLGRTFVERLAGTGFGPWTTGDDEVYLLAFDVQDVTRSTDCELYRHGSLVKENFLPTWATLTADQKAAIRANYTTTVGVN